MERNKEKAARRRAMAGRARRIVLAVLGIALLVIIGGCVAMNICSEREDILFGHYDTALTNLTIGSVVGYCLLLCLCTVRSRWRAVEVLRRVGCVIMFLIALMYEAFGVKTVIELPESYKVAKGWKAKTLAERQMTADLKAGFASGDKATAEAALLRWHERRKAYFGTDDEQDDWYLVTETALDIERAYIKAVARWSKAGSAVADSLRSDIYGYRLWEEGD